MKRCPSCRRAYADDTLVYCLEDGSALVADIEAGSDMPATVIMQDPRPTSPARQETLRQATPQPAPLHSYGQPQANWQPAAGTHLPAFAAPAGQGRGLAVSSLVGAIAAFALLGFCFIGGATGVNQSLLGGLFILAAAIGLAGAVLGIVAVSKAGKDTSPQNSKATAVVGLVLNCLYLLITLLFLILGATGSLG